MDTILSRIIVESMVLSGRVKRAEQGRSGNPFKRNKRYFSLDESSPTFVLGSTPSKESISERSWDGYIDLLGFHCGSFCCNWNGHLPNFSWPFWNINKILFSFTFHRFCHLLSKNKSNILAKRPRSDPLNSTVSAFWASSVFLCLR